MPKATILVVDDAPENLDVVRAVITPEFTMKAAISGPVALEIASHHCPDLILLDVTMPGMDGFEVCRRLRENQRTRAVPVLFLTAWSDPEHHERARKLGAAGLIEKPIDPQRLRERIRAELSAGNTRG